MKNIKLIVISLVLLAFGFGTNRAINDNSKDSNKVDTRVDNQGYWLRAAAKGLVSYNPEIKTKPAVYTGSKIVAKSVSTLDSPDVPVTDLSSTQSENSVFINPLDETIVLNTNNSTNGTMDTAFGANSLFSFTSGETWEGSIEGPGENNGGDPAAIIGLNGRWYINYINNNRGMGVSYSDDKGETWTVTQAAPNPGDITDKNHMWIDNNPNSPYEGNLYIAWTNIGGMFNGEIGFSYSIDDGETWTLNENISSDVNAGSHNQGVNLSTGPNGELYAIWAIYDTWFSSGSDETAIGMTTSFDGGVTWEPARRIITDIRGIRSTKTSKNMRVNSFPVATVDNSNGADKGAIYITWSNIGPPGINTGDDIDVYIVKSTDLGITWSTPLRVNNDEPGFSKQHFFPWITCDPANGILSMIYYDDRNVNPDQCEVYCANSIDGGTIWEEFKVSDVSFTPAPIPGLADKYMGDYLGIHSRNGVVYPIWTDNRTGNAMSYCSPYETNPVNRPFDLTGEIIDETGIINLSWSYELADGFLNFIIYRDGDSISSTIDSVFSESLPDYGIYNYRVTAYYSGEIESGASGISLQWGEYEILIATDSIFEHIAIGDSSERQLMIINQGQLNLEYSINLFTPPTSRAYCSAIGNSGTGSEYISAVEVGDISNLNTGNNNYSDYSNMATTMTVGNKYDITVTSSNPFDLDQCGVWVDWSGDEVFDEDEITVLNLVVGTGVFTGSIVPPPGAISGNTKMRVRLTYTGDLIPCGSTIFGEVEDYTVLVHGWVDVFPLQGIVEPGDTNFVNVNFNATDLPEGYYSTKAIIISNDPVNSIIELPLSLRVDHLVVNTSVNLPQTCSGQIVVLMAEINGVFDSISYIWTSQPIGFNSTMIRPFALPLVSTWYKVEIIDGEHTSVDSVFVEVLPLPEINLGPDSTICGSGNFVLDAGNTGLTFLWSTGDTTQTIIVDTTGTGFGLQNISVEVTDTNGCTGLDDITIDFVNCSGVDENVNKEVNVYPNPNNGSFFIKTDYITVNINVKLLDVSGTIVYENIILKNTETSTFNIVCNNLRDGVYLLLLNIDNHKYKQKIIVKK